MSTQLQQARSFIADVELPPRPLSGAIPQNADPTIPVFETVKEQAAVVGSDVVSFVSGVDAATRGALSNCALLAQLAANSRVPEKKNIYAWYKAYFEVLSSIGWTVQEDGFAEFSETSDGFEVHEKIMEVAAILLGPGTTALAVIKSTLDALKAMESDNGWLTIFERETQHAEAARFQISVAEQSGAGDVMVSMMAFGVEASNKVTQVLFFKIKKHKAKLRHNSAKMSIDSGSLTDLAEDIRKRVRDYQRAFIANLTI